MREMLIDHIVREDFQVLMLFTVIEDLKCAEAHMRGRHAHQHRAGFDLLAIDLVVAPDETERLRRRNPQAMHRCAAEILTDRRAQNRPAVPVARKRGHARRL